MPVFYRKTIIFLPAIFLFIFDRLLKRIFLASPESEVFLWGDFLKFKLAYNKGIAFGLGVSLDNQIFLYSCIFIFLFLCFFLVKFFIAKKYFFVFCLSLIALGAFSNLLDRIYFGGVVDYFDFKWFTIFNLADVMITTGVVMILVKSLKSKVKN